MSRRRAKTPQGNVGQKIIDQLDIFAAYRTAPYIDVRETMVRLVDAGQMP